MRLRSTALPTFLVTVKPMRANGRRRGGRGDRRLCGPPGSLHRECGAMGSAAARRGAEVGAALQARRAGRRPGQAESFFRPRERRRRDDGAATDGRHARPEPVAALAHDLAGLIGPLHRVRSGRSAQPRPRAMIRAGRSPALKAADHGAGRMRSAL